MRAMAPIMIVVAPLALRICQALAENLERVFSCGNTDAGPSKGAGADSGCVTAEVRDARSSWDAR